MKPISVRKAVRLVNADIALMALLLELETITDATVDPKVALQAGLEPVAALERLLRRRHVSRKTLAKLYQIACLLATHLIPFVEAREKRKKAVRKASKYMSN